MVLGVTDVTEISPADYSSLILYIFSLSITDNSFFSFFYSQCCSRLLNDMVDERIPLHLGNRECILVITKNILVSGMELVVCWSTLHYQRDSFIVLEGMSICWRCSQRGYEEHALTSV